MGHSKWDKRVLTVASREMYSRLGMRMGAISRVEAVLGLRELLELPKVSMSRKEAADFLLKWFREVAPEEAKAACAKRSKPQIGLAHKRRRQFKPNSRYSEYLQSDLWNAIRGCVLLRDKNECYGCGKRATQVHHRNYSEETMRGRDVSGLVAVCGACHRWIEFDGEKKVALEVANTRLEILRAERFGESLELDREFLELVRAG